MAVIYRTETKSGALLIYIDRNISDRLKSFLTDNGYKKYENVWIGRKNQEEILSSLKKWEKRALANKHFPQTLCWQCFHSDKGERSICSWASSFKPVEGWDAIYNIVHCTYSSHGKTLPTTIESYCVKKCPLFEKG